MSIRINAGLAKGMPLKSPPGDQTRPTSSKVREAVWNSLRDVLDAAVLFDAFSGSGAIGIDALSLGAQEVQFCETHRPSLKVLKENISELQKRLAKQSHFAKLLFSSKPAEKHIKGFIDEKFDLIWFDPPYAMISSLVPLMKRELIRVLKKDSYLILESDPRNQDGYSSIINDEKNFEVIKHKEYGNIVITICRKIGD